MRTSYGKCRFGLILAVFVAAGLVVTDVDAQVAPGAGESGVPLGGVGPDVTVIYLDEGGNPSNYGSVGGIRAYSLGTTSCNVGDEPLSWCNNSGGCGPLNDEEHPVIAQNMYRLKDGRFEQIGMSWLKHGFLSLNSSDPDCVGATGGGACLQPPQGGDQLGVGCTDLYGPGLNGSRPLGMRSEVNPSTGVFPYPYTVISSPQLIDQRIQVDETDLDPAQNPGARYFMEGQYIASDDAADNNAFNNASHQEVTVSAGTFSLNFLGDTVRERSALYAWQTIDPNVEIVNGDIALSTPQERFEAARRVTNLPEGGLHYEYAIRNMNSDRAANSFTVTFPGPTTFSNVGFRDVDHHSGEPYATTDWIVSFAEGADSITWSTDSEKVDPDANALRWGTTFTFWFDADRSPDSVTHALGLFKNGGSVSLDFSKNFQVFADGFESGSTTAWSLTIDE